MTHPWKTIPLRLIPAARSIALCFGLYLRAEAGAKDLCLFLFNVIWIVTFLSFRRRSWPFSKTGDAPLVSHGAPLPARRAKPPTTSPLPLTALQGGPFSSKFQHVWIINTQSTSRTVHRDSKQKGKSSV